MCLNKEDVVVFNLSGEYAHYSHPATNYSSLTYPIPTKTSIMGLIGAVVGLDTYNELNDMRYSVSMNNELVKKEYQFNGILKALSSSLKLKEGYQRSDEKKQFKRELVCNPSYTIYLDISKLEVLLKSKIKDYIKNHKSHYGICMGINTFHADFENIEIESFSKCEEDEMIITSLTSLDSFIFDIKNPSKITNIRFALNVKSEERIFSNFQDFIIEISGKQKILAKNNDDIYLINNKGICFV